MLLSNAADAGSGIVDKALAEAVKALAEAITGARATPGDPRTDGEDLVTIVDLDWDGCPGGFDLPKRAEIRVSPFGDYDARFEGAREAFTSGLVQEMLTTPLTIRFGVLIQIMNREEFRSEMGASGDGEVGPSDLERAMIRLPVAPDLAGIDRILVCNLSPEEDRLYFEVEAEVSDIRRFVRAAREAYLEAWWDNTWIPTSPQEALFELALGSNANPPPDDLGFQILEYPVTRAQVRRATGADLAVQQSPSLVPDAPLSYSGWLEVTGLDDSFVGDGVDRPGTRDLYAAAMRALSAPGQTCPEPS